MEKLPSKSKSDTKNIVNDQIGKFLALFIILTFFGALLCNILNLPRACNENPQDLIMKLESQVQKSVSNLATVIEDWVNSDNSFAIISKYFLGFVLAVFVYFLHDFIVKNSFFTFLSFTTCYAGFCWLGNIVARDYIFQDSSDRCQKILTLRLEFYQTIGLAYIAFIVFIKLQHVLSKSTKLN